MVLAACNILGNIKTKKLGDRDARSGTGVASTACRTLYTPRASRAGHWCRYTPQTSMGWPFIASQGVKSWRGHFFLRNASTGKTTGTVNIS